MNHVKAVPVIIRSLMPQTPISSKKFLSQTTSSAMVCESEVRRIWRDADCICFDVDSTVIKDEGLDDLAQFCGVGEEIKKMTMKAMGGGLPFREALTQRLNIVNPSREQMNEFVAMHPPQLSSGISELVRLLHDLDRPVFLVSGGFHAIIKPVAAMLNIPPSRVYANDIFFDAEGKYAGFDLSCPTSETGGKIKVVQELREKHGFQTMVFIGDGATDLETYPPVDAFIGYGGNVVRETVRKAAHWFVTDFQDLIREINES